jgi:hypothetical protein
MKSNIPMTWQSKANPPKTKGLGGSGMVGRKLHRQSHARRARVSGRWMLAWVELKSRTQDNERASQRGK